MSKCKSGLKEVVLCVIYSGYLIKVTRRRTLSLDEIFL